MNAHSLRQPERDVQGLVKRIRKKSQDGFSAPADSVNVIGPVNKKATPNHDRQDREIDPVKPPDCQRVFFYYFFHLLIKSGILHPCTKKTFIKFGKVLMW